jgi:hypothetical protein
LNQAPAELTLTLLPTDTNSWGGAVFGFRGARNFHVIERGPAGRWDIRHFEGNRFQDARRRTFPASGAAAEVTLISGEGLTTLKFDGNTLTLTDTSGHMGAWVRHGRMRFRSDSTVANKGN